MKKKSNKIKVIIIVILLVLIAAGAIVLYTNKKEVPQEETPTVEVDESLEAYKKEYEENYAINNDYVGKLVFKSGLLDLPVVQGDTNETYLRKDWETGEYSEYGSIFADYECTLDDQNYVIYGHYVYSTYVEDASERMFTPLGKLIDEENYKDNDLIEFRLKDEVRTYQIVAVYYCNLIYEDGDYYLPEGYEYYNPNFTDEFFETYKANVKASEFYDPGVDYDNENDYLTLQTCVENREDLREIVLAKHVGVEQY